MVASYAELVDAVSAEINRPEIEQSLPLFVRLTEGELNRRLRHWRMERRATATASSGSRYVSLPEDWIEAVRVSTTVEGVTRRLELAPDPAMLDARAARNGVGGVPTHYLITAGELELFPSPAGDHTIEMVYRAKLPGINDSSPTTNWLLDEAPDAYFYGTLVRAGSHVADPRVAEWKPLFEAIIGELNVSAEVQRHSGSGLRMAKRGLS